MTSQVRIYRAFDSDMEEVWHRLQGDCDYFMFQTYEWLAHWQHTIGDHSYGIEPCVAVVSDSGGPVALFPFGVRKIFGVRVLEFLGGVQSDYNAPLISSAGPSPGQFTQLWNSVMEALPAHDVRSLVRMPETCGGFRNPVLDAVPSFCEGASYGATLPDSWEEFRQRLPSKFQKDNARMIRRLSEKGHFEFVVAATVSEFNEIVEVMFSQKEQRYKETGARNILADPHTRDFYRGLGELVAEDAKVHLSALVVNGEILATHLGAVHNGRFYYLFPTFAGAAWSKYSPGRLLLEKLVQWAIDNRISIFDFTIGGEAYKNIWCDSEMNLYRAVEVRTFRGRFFDRAQRLIYWVKTNQKARAIAMGIIRKLHSFRPG